MFLKTTIASAALAGLVGGAQAADATRYVAPPSGVEGDILLGLGSINEGSDGEGYFQGAGRANVPLGGGMWNFEVQTGGKAVFVGGEGSDPLSVNAYLHLWNRLPNAAWGLFGGADFQAGPQFTAFGVEGKHYVGNMTFGAAAGFANVGWMSSGTGWLLNATGNYYFTPNHRIGVQVAALSAGNIFGSGGTIWEVTGDFEHRFDNRPFSLFASVSTIGFSGKGPDSIWTALGGFKVYLDHPGSTLYSHEQSVPWTILTPVFGEAS